MGNRDHPAKRIGNVDEAGISDASTRAIAERLLRLQTLEVANASIGVNLFSNTLRHTGASTTCCRD